MHQGWRVVARLGRGLTNRQIAAALVVSKNTVETHLKHAYDKLVGRHRGEVLATLFRDAYPAGLREPDLSPSADERVR